MSHALRFSAFVFCGMIALQFAWIITMPPFHGIDEFDHVHRAAGVADGEWRLSVDTAEGRGLLTTVPRGLVDAARAQCEALPYPLPDNCVPVDDLGGGRVTISTAAGSYHPAYYFVIGSVAHGFDGAAADYAMRTTSALISAGGVAVAAFCLVIWAPGRWARFGFLVALTPVLVYTSVIPAPNSIEIVAGLCLWTSLLGFAQGRAPEHETLLLWVAITSAAVLATVRYLGPMWLGLILVTVVILAGPYMCWRAVKRRPGLVVVGSVLVTAAVLGSAWWTVTSGLTGLSEDQAEVGSGVEVDLGLQPVVWLLQVIAAFPLRGDVAPPAVYAIWLLVFLALLTAGFAQAGGRRVRVALVLMVLVVVALPIMLTLRTMETHGVIWQGRYGLAFAVGLAIVAGVTMDESPSASRETPRLILLGCALLGIAHVWALVHVRIDEVADSVARADPAWLAPSPALVGGLTLAAWVVLWIGVRDRSDGESELASAASG